MAGRPLRPATDRRFGRPLPCQLANQTRGHPIPPQFFTLEDAFPCAYAVLTVVSNWYPPEWGRFPTRYSPVRHSVNQIFLPKDSVLIASFNLHVLGTPPAFILSQDQTLVKSLNLIQNNVGYFSSCHSLKLCLLLFFWNRSKRCPLEILLKFQGWFISIYCLKFFKTV